MYSGKKNTGSYPEKYVLLLRPVFVWTPLEIPPDYDGPLLRLLYDWLWAYPFLWSSLEHQIGSYDVVYWKLLHLELEWKDRGNKFHTLEGENKINTNDEKLFFYKHNITSTIQKH